MLGGLREWRPFSPWIVCAQIIKLMSQAEVKEKVSWARWGGRAMVLPAADPGSSPGTA